MHTFHYSYGLKWNVSNYWIFLILLFFSSVYWHLQRACPPSVPFVTAPGETAATDEQVTWCSGASLAGVTHYTYGIKKARFPWGHLNGCDQKVTVHHKSEILHRTVHCYPKGPQPNRTDLSRHPSNSMQNFFGEGGLCFHWIWVWTCAKGELFPVALVQ